MIEKLKALEVDWSMEQTVAAIDKAIAEVKTGKGGEPLYKVITQKIAETEDYFDRPQIPVERRKGGTRHGR